MYDNIKEAKTGYVVEFEDGSRYLVKYSPATPKGLALDDLLPSGVATNGDMVIEQVRQGYLGVKCLNGAKW